MSNKVKPWKEARNNCQNCDDRPRVACTAVQHSDQMVCADCDQRWDANDPAPPPCQITELRIGDTIGWEGDRWQVVGFVQRGPSSMESETCIRVRRV